MQVLSFSSLECSDLNMLKTSQKNSTGVVTRPCNLTIQCVTYGCGTVFERNKFQEPKNGALSIKPFGGLWGSPVGSRHSWYDWCLDNEFGLSPLSESFEWEFRGVAAVIHSQHDLDKLAWKSDPRFDLFQEIDFEEMLANGVDGIYLTADGEPETRFLSGKNLYGWDCETVLALNPDSIFPA